jgi:2-succinyl-5-enolpyruvyl-6-hydroxy-3-cyclohexene-1-carboxylate synthase
VNDGDVALACMRALVGWLASFGMRDACLSPGSRSTPIALALARDDRVRLHVHLDERSAAFFALGLAKASGRPVAVACTSGTAAANLFPAIVEATMSRTPVIALTADRPPELRGVGANQTIDQIELFGRYVRWFLDAPVPSFGPDPRATWFDIAFEAYRRACSPGPVHVNLPFREPLVPTDSDVVLPDEVAVTPGLLPHPSPPAGPPVREPDLRRFVEGVEGVERGLVLAWPVGWAGPWSPSRIRGAGHPGPWPPGPSCSRTSGSRRITARTSCSRSAPPPRRGWRSGWPATSAGC